jgi:hypothetical protein
LYREILLRIKGFQIAFPNSGSAVPLCEFS